jgi:hypothetical protein
MGVVLQVDKVNELDCLSLFLTRKKKPFMAHTMNG